MLLRHSLDQLGGENDAVGFDIDDPALRPAVAGLVEQLIRRVRLADGAEADETAEQVWALLREWSRRASESRDGGSGLRYDRAPGADSALLKRFGQHGEGWLVGDSMRSVEPNVAVEVREPTDG